MRNNTQRKVFFSFVTLLFIGAFCWGLYSGLSSRGTLVSPSVQFGIVIRSGDVGKQRRVAESSVGCPISLIAVDSLWDDDFPFDAVQYISKKGAVPVVRWTPLFGDAFEEFTFSSISDGTWDDHISRWAERARQSEYPLVISLFCDFNREEMGIEDMDLQSENAKAAFRYIVKKFDDKKATNVIWVWQVAGDYEVISPQTLATYYPGNDVVDWIGLSISYSPRRLMQEDFLELVSSVVPSENIKSMMVTVADIRPFPEQLDWVKSGVAFAVSNKAVKAVLLDVPEAFPFKEVKGVFLSDCFHESFDKK